MHFLFKFPFAKHNESRNRQVDTEKQFSKKYSNFLFDLLRNSRKRDSYRLKQFDGESRPHYDLFWDGGNEAFITSWK